jgi:membrane-bound lytic murein transglycosylase B
MMPTNIRQVSVVAVVLAGLSACTDAPADNRLQFTASTNAQPLSPQGASPQGMGSQGTREWSGQSGASGHPTMTADAIRAAAADFPNCLARLWPEATRRGISQQTYRAYTSDLTPDLRLMDLMDMQPEFTKAVWEYLDTLVSEARIARGREILEQHRAAFDAAERNFGVDRHIIAAIWGVETNYSTLGGDRPVVRSTATLACVGRRQAFFRDEFFATLEILQRGDVHPDRLRGSWAGAFGATQFMPSTFKRYAVDFDRDGRRDIVESVPDIVASTANFLKTSGWVPGQSWGYEVALPREFNFMLADRNRQMTFGDWQNLGVRRANGSPLPHSAERTYLVIPAGARGPAFLMTQNFRAIMRYNPAEAYAIAIGHLADRLRGAPAFVQAWPRDERVLSLSERLELQQHLARRGYDIGGEPDGVFGPRSRGALMQFQARSGLPADGFATAAVLDRLRGQ